MTVTPEIARATLTARKSQRDAVLLAEAARLRALLVGALATRDVRRPTWLFGSLVWGGFHEHSDVDIGVEGLTADDADGLRAALEPIVGRPVEVLRLESLPASFAERIRSEGVRLL